MKQNENELRECMINEILNTHKTVCYNNIHQEIGKNLY